MLLPQKENRKEVKYTPLEICGTETKKKQSRKNVRRNAFENESLA